jgi:hypothetical protein
MSSVQSMLQRSPLSERPINTLPLTPITRTRPKKVAKRCWNDLERVDGEKRSGKKPRTPAQIQQELPPVHIYSDGIELPEDDSYAQHQPATAPKEKKGRKRPSKFQKMVVIKYFLNVKFRQWENILDDYIWVHPTIDQLKEQFPQYHRSMLGRWVEPKGMSKICNQPSWTKSVREYWTPHWPEMEELLLAEFLEKRAKNMIIKRWWFRERARALFAQCHPEYPTAFCFSRGWFSGFLKRNGLSLRAITKIVSSPLCEMIMNSITDINSHKNFLQIPNVMFSISFEEFGVCLSPNSLLAMDLNSYRRRFVILYVTSLRLKCLTGNGHLLACRWLFLRTDFPRA